MGEVCIIWRGHYITHLEIYKQVNWMPYKNGFKSGSNPLLLCFGKLYLKYDFCWKEILSWFQILEFPISLWIEFLWRGWRGGMGEREESTSTKVPFQAQKLLKRWGGLSINYIHVLPKALVKMRNASYPLFPLGYFVHLGILLPMNNTLIQN